MEYVVFCLIAYIIGSIPSALLVGKIGYNIDVREHGSGNLGATNAFRTLGIKAGIIVTISDILKGTIAIIIPLLIFKADVHPLIIGIFVILGHTYPLFAKFKGGKAVATSGGVFLGINPLLFLMMIVSFILSLYLSKYVSLASIITGIVSTIISLFFKDMSLTIALVIITSFVIYRHKQNIIRIKNGTEPKITWM